MKLALKLYKTHEKYNKNANKIYDYHLALRQITGNLKEWHHIQRGISNIRLHDRMGKKWPMKMRSR